MSSIRFDESKHRRHGKGSRHGGRFAPKPAPQAADVAAPLMRWLLLLWHRCDIDRYMSRDVGGGAGAEDASRIIIQSRWMVTAANAREAVRGGLKEAARRLGATKTERTGLSSSWLSIVDVPDGACAALPLLTSEGVVFLQASYSTDIATGALYMGAYGRPFIYRLNRRFGFRRVSHPPQVCCVAKMVPSVTNVAASAGQADDGYALNSAVEMLKSLSHLPRNFRPSRIRPEKACPENPALLVETLARLGRSGHLDKTLGVTFPRNPPHDKRPLPLGVLSSGLYARLLSELPADPFAWRSAKPPPLMGSLANERKKKFMYRPRHDMLNDTSTNILAGGNANRSVGVTLLRAAAATDPDNFHTKTAQHKADALAAAARRSEMGALVGFTTGIFPPCDPAAEAALEQLLQDPANDWCDPDDFRRKIATLHSTAYLKAVRSNWDWVPACDLKAASEKLDAALTVAADKPGQPVAHAEAECVRTLLIERGTLIPSGQIAKDRIPAFGPAVFQSYSALSRQQHMACAHRAQPEMALPGASKKLAARMGDYARWVMAHTDKGEARKLTGALLTVPDLPPKLTAGLFVLLRKHIESNGDPAGARVGAVR